MEENKRPPGKNQKEKAEELLKAYKVPLIFSALSIIPLVIYAIILLRGTLRSGEVVFTSGSVPTSSVKTVMVDVEGAVNRPGVYRFYDGARIEDALRDSGGLSDGADTEWTRKNLNRAAKLADGGKIYIPYLNENSKTNNQRSGIIDNSGAENNFSRLLGVSEGLVNINTAGQKELETLPGIGEVTAGKIIAGRQYQAIEDLKSKKIVGNAVHEKIRELITVY